MQEQGYDKAPLCPTPGCQGLPQWMATFADSDRMIYKCRRCGHEIYTTPLHVVEYDTAQSISEPKTPVITFSILDLTQEDYKLLIEALEMAVTCKEVEVDVAQAEADSKADTLRDLVVLKRKLETA